MKRESRGGRNVRTLVVLAVLALVLGAATSCRSEPKVAPAKAAAAVEGELPEWNFGGRSLRVQLGVVPLDYFARVRAETREAAKALFEPFRREGTRIPLPPGVEVDAFTSLELSGGRICVHDSVSSELDVFRITV